MFLTLDWSVSDGIGVATLKRPPQNHLDSRAFGELADLADRLASGGDPETSGLRGLIIRGQGKHFSSGADLDELGSLLKGQSAEPEFLARNSRALDRLGRLPFPTVAAITGCCLGAGLELALACGYRVAAANAMLAFPESGFGIIPGCGGTVRIGRLLPPGRAIELVLSGRYVMAEEARAIGLVDCVVERGRELEAARTLLRALGPVILPPPGGPAP